MTLFKPLPPRPELDALVKQSIAAFEELTPAQQAAHRHAQRRSWVRGELMLEHPEMTREEADRLVNNALGPEGKQP